MTEPRIDLSRVELGERLKHYRGMRQMSLRELGEATSTTPGFLSQLEKGKTSASIGSLRRISAALGLTLANLFQEGPIGDLRVLRKEDRELLRSSAGCRKYLLSQRPLRHMEVFAVEFDPGASTGPEPFSHDDSQELVCVIEGEVTAYINGESHVLKKGDSIDYMSSMPHRIANNSSSYSEITWILSPQTGQLAVKDI